MAILGAIREGEHAARRVPLGGGSRVRPPPIGGCPGATSQPGVVPHTTAFLARATRSGGWRLRGRAARASGRTAISGARARPDRARREGGHSLRGLRRALPCLADPTRATRAGRRMRQKTTHALRGRRRARHPPKGTARTSSRGGP